ncbi:hypothetical protein F4815DRAFT_90758 [Daldinia loculata]|nr:hypothetical protein F4815DRAFT_90758 [Daldinia loculata]
MLCGSLPCISLLFLTYSTNDRPGAFAEYEYDLVWRIPDQLSLEQASSITVNGLTAAQTIFGRRPQARRWPGQRPHIWLEHFPWLIFGTGDSSG